MPSNEQVLIDRAIQADQEGRPTPLPGDVAFELFACEQVLKQFELSADEVESGRIGGGMDGGIDGAYVFLGDALLSEDSDVFAEDFVVSSTPREQQLTMWVIQAKREESFSETAIDKVASSLDRLLDLSKDEGELLKLYSSELVKRIRFFTNAWSRLISRKPKLAIRFVYVTRGSTSSINQPVRIKTNDLESLLVTKVPGAECKATFIGAAELWELKNQSPTYQLKLSFKENATMGDSHIALVRIADYFSFIADEKGALRRHIFDWNVRDFQGDVEVNREIRESLIAESTPDFWWMNNGVTVVCSSASIVSKTYHLDDVQIVNGLQTSHIIYEVMAGISAKKEISASNSLLVRILVTGDAGTRDKVIRATNRQTSVPDASLRATDEIQRKIESYFADNEWYYDRRKNYYKNIGKQPARIVSIPYLAQAVMAIGLARPDSSRARPSSLLKRDDDYRRVFSRDIPLQTYLWLARTQKTVDSYLAASSIGTSASERTNVRFHVSMLAVARLHGSPIYSPKQLRKLAEDNTEMSQEHIDGTLEGVLEHAKAFLTDKDWSQDRLAKSREFVTFVLEEEFPTA